MLRDNTLYNKRKTLLFAYFFIYLKAAQRAAWQRRGRRHIMSLWPWLRIQRLENIRFGQENLTPLHVGYQRQGRDTSAPGEARRKAEVPRLCLNTLAPCMHFMVFHRKLGITVKGNHYIFILWRTPFIRLHGNSFSTLLPNWNVTTLIIHSYRWQHIAAEKNSAFSLRLTFPC